MIPLRDPYDACEARCTHDLARAVLVSELLGGDGPHSEPSIFGGPGWRFYDAPSDAAASLRLAS